MALRKFIAISSLAFLGTAEARRGGGGRGGRGNLLEKLEDCTEEISFSCSDDFDFDFLALMDTLTQLQADKEAAIAAGEKPQPVPDDVRASLEQVRQCIKAIKPSLSEDSACRAALSGPGKPGGKGGKPGGKGGKPGPCTDGSKPHCANGENPIKTPGSAPLCADGSEPLCADGSEPAQKPRPTCADGSVPTRVCADGSTPVQIEGEKRPTCADGGKPTLVCDDGSTPDKPTINKPFTAKKQPRNRRHAQHKGRKHH